MSDPHDTPPDQPETEKEPADEVPPDAPAAGVVDEEREDPPEPSEPG